MKTKLLIFSLLLTLSISCVEEGEYVTENNSNYTITFDVFSNPNSTLVKSFKLPLGDTKKYTRSLTGSFSEAIPFEGSVDSIKVTFNDNISVFHGSTLYNLERSLLLKSSFNQITDKATLREFEYIFTEEDYQEALTHQ